jgi:methionine sulfoxide reductase heme-binding subunit
MKASNKPSGGPGIPWAGGATLALAAFAAGLLLSGRTGLAAILQTWYLSRAAGLIAYVLLFLSVAVGLLQSSGFLKGTTSPLANIDIHGFLSVTALYATIFHAVVLVWDQYIPFRWSDILLPFAGAFKPALVGLGSVAFYLALLVTLSTYLRAKLSAKAWRSLHWSSLIAFAFALIHGLFLGTDTNLPAVGFLYRFTGIGVAVLISYRIYKEVRAYADSARRG